MYAILSLTFIIKCWIRWKSCSIKIQRCNSTRRITTFNKRPTLLSNSSQIQRLQKRQWTSHILHINESQKHFFPLLRIYTFEQIALPSVSTSTSRHTILFLGVGTYCFILSRLSSLRVLGHDMISPLSWDRRYHVFWTEELRCTLFIYFTKHSLLSFFFIYFVPLLPSSSRPHPHMCFTSNE